MILLLKYLYYELVCPTNTKANILIIFFSSSIIFTFFNNLNTTPSVKTDLIIINT